VQPQSPNNTDGKVGKIQRKPGFKTGILGLFTKIKTHKNLTDFSIFIFAIYHFFK
jgi:hypothetical protein